MKKISVMKIIKIIFCAFFAVFISIGVVAICMQAVLKFSFEMVPRLFVPIIIVAIPVYIFLYKDLFNDFFKKKK